MNPAYFPDQNISSGIRIPDLTPPCTLLSCCADIITAFQVGGSVQMKDIVIK